MTQHVKSKKRNQIMWFFNISKKWNLVFECPDFIHFCTLRVPAQDKCEVLHSPEEQMAFQKASHQKLAMACFQYFGFYGISGIYKMVCLWIKTKKQSLNLVYPEIASPALDIIISGAEIVKEIIQATDLIGLQLWNLHP